MWPRNITILLFIITSLGRPWIAVDDGSTGIASASVSTTFAELVKREIENDAIAKAVYESSDLKVFMAQIALAIRQRRFPSDEERNKLRSVFHNIVSFMVKDVTPETFWETRLSAFLAKNLSSLEAEEILKVYPPLDETRAGQKLSRLRLQFVSEVSPLWQQLIQSRIQSFKIPAGGMIPSLLIGDHIVIDKFAYQFKKPERAISSSSVIPKTKEKASSNELLVFRGTPSGFTIRSSI